MFSRHGILLLGIGMCVAVAAQHIILGMHKAPVQVDGLPVFQYAGFSENKRQLATPHEAHCQAKDKSAILQARLDQLRTFGRGNSAQIVQIDGESLLMEGFYLGMPVLFGPCRGTYIDPTYGPPREQGGQ